MITDISCEVPVTNLQLVTYVISNYDLHNLRDIVTSTDISHIYESV